MKADIAVVGSGLAALVATRSVQTRGRKPVLIWPGLSSLYFVYATVDVLGYADDTSREPIENPDAAVAALIRDHPDHPYAKAGLGALRDGVILLMSWLKEAGFAWDGRLDQNLLLPTAIGAAKPSCLAPASMVAGDLRRDDPMVLCGFDGYEDFVPELAASNLSRTGRSVRAVRVRLPHFEPGRLFTSIDLARNFEDTAFRRDAAQRIKGALGPVSNGVRVGLPAVLGLTHDGQVHHRIEEDLGHPVFEIPTLPPSVLGLRLFDRLRKHLQETGVELILAAPAHAAEVRDGRCLRIHLKSAGKAQPVEAGAYVLALEDAVDGALRAGVHTMQDPFFHLTLARSAMPSERTNESLFKPQPFAGIGYRLTNRLQPIDGAGPIANNVFIAGGAISGYEPTGTKSRGGLAIATGYRAAQEAMAA